MYFPLSGIHRSIHDFSCAGIAACLLLQQQKQGLLDGDGPGKGSCQKKTFFLGYLSQMWVGGVADSQTRFKPLKKKPNHPENRLF